MAGRRLALLVSTSNYQDQAFGQLQSPAADVAALSGVLNDPAIGGYEVRRLDDATSYEVNQAIESFFSDARPNDSIMLYFSGHGFRDRGNRLFMMTRDSQSNLLGSTAISAQFVRDQLERCRSRRKIVILDCCYAGAFPAGATKSGQKVDVIGEFGGRGSVVITASSAIQYALAGGGEAPAEVDGAVKTSVFTGALIEGITTGSADINGDGIIDIDELYNYVHDQVTLKVPDQTPQKKSDVEGTLFVARSPQGPRPARLPTELLDAMHSPLASTRFAVITDLVAACSGARPGVLLSVRDALRELIEDDSMRVAKAAREALARIAPPAEEARPAAAGEGAPVPEDLAVAARREADDIIVAARQEAARLRAEIQQEREETLASVELEPALSARREQLLRLAEEKAVELVQGARAEAREIVSDARKQADQIVSEAKKQVDEILAQATSIAATLTEEAAIPPRQQPRSDQASQASATRQPEGATETAGKGPYVTPLVRQLAEEHGVDLALVKGTGIAGRVRKQDVLEAAETQSSRQPTKTGAQSDEDWWTE